MASASGVKVITYEDVKAYMAENYTDKKSGWSCSENQKEKKGMSITIYQRKVEGSNINLARTDSKFKGQTLD